MNASISSIHRCTVDTISVQSACRSALESHRPAPTAALLSRASTLLLTLLLCGAFAPTASAADLTVKVDGVPSAKGTVLLELDDSAAGWDDKAKPVATGGAKAVKGDVTYTFKNILPGTYAVGVIHDENDNGKLDTNFLGIPKEGYGFSNNTTAMRKPTFEEAHFEIGQQDVSILIHMAHAL